MYKIKNKGITIKTSKKTYKTHNRVLDNYLDWMIYAILPSDIGNTLFPKFSEFGYAYLPLEESYVQVNTTQTIEDTSTTMAFEASSYTLEPSDITEEVGETSKLITTEYTFLGLYTTGDKLTGVGFGREHSIVDDYLMSFVDLSPAQLVVSNAVDYSMLRYDEVSTNETPIGGDVGYLPGYRYGQLQSITTCFGLGGNRRHKNYNVADLTFTYVSAGKVAVTGFDNFFLEQSDTLIYPSDTLYPGDICLTTELEQFKSVIFEYLGNDDDATVYETYINIKDLDISYNDKVMSLNLVAERGE